MAEHGVEMPGEGADPIIIPDAVLNFEIRQMLNRIRVFILNILGSQSHEIQGETEEDVKRIKDFLSNIQSNWDLVCSEEIDAPWVQPQDFPVVTYDELKWVQNMDMFDLSTTAGAMYQSMGRCDSSRTGGAILASDKRRINRFLARLNAKVVIIEAQLAEDAPEAPDAAPPIQGGAN